VFSQPILWQAKITFIPNLLSMDIHGKFGNPDKYTPLQIASRKSKNGENSHKTVHIVQDSYNYIYECFGIETADQFIHKHQD